MYFFFHCKLLWRSQILPVVPETNHFCPFTALIKALLLWRGPFNCTPYSNNVSLLMMSHILYWLACRLITSPPSNNTVVSRASARGPSTALPEHKGCWIMSSHPHDCSLGRAWRTLIMDTTMGILTPNVPCIRSTLPTAGVPTPTTPPHLNLQWERCMWALTLLIEQGGGGTWQDISRRDLRIHSPNLALGLITAPSFPPPFFTCEGFSAASPFLTVFLYPFFSAMTGGGRIKWCLTLVHSLLLSHTLFIYHRKATGFLSDKTLLV